MKAEEFFKTVRANLQAPKSYGSYNQVEKDRLRQGIIEARKTGRGLKEDEEEFLVAEREDNRLNDNPRNPWKK